MPSLLLVSAKLNFFLKMSANLSGPLLPIFLLAKGHHYIPSYERCNFCQWNHTFDCGDLMATLKDDCDQFFIFSGVRELL
jgi:hypothetical protein